MAFELKELFANSQVGIITPAIEGFNFLWQVALIMVFFVAFEVIAYIIACVVAKIVKVILLKSGLDSEVAKSKFHDSIGKISPSELLGQITKWGIFIMFTITTAQTFTYLKYFPTVILDISLFLPKVLAAIVILLLGLIVSDVAAHILEQINIKGIKLAALVTKIIIMFFIITIALENLGLKGIDSIQNSFYILLGGFTLAFSLAMGIGLGLGFKEEAKELIQELLHGKQVVKKK